MRQQRRRTGTIAVSLWILLLVGVSIALPLILVHQADRHTAVPDPLRAYGDEPAITVFRTVSRQVETYPLERYVRGVVAAEMPADFPLEALKAQAIAARTYAVRRMEESVKPAGLQGAWVSDGTDDQVFWSEQEMKQHWGDHYSSYLGNVTAAVQETKGRIMLYGGQPIVAAFFSTSNGYTENSEDYWKDRIPYLRSVPSPWDERLSPKYRQSVVMLAETFFRKLGWSGKMPPLSALKKMDVSSWTAGRRIGVIRIAGRSFTGREMREKLGLASASFSWQLQADRVSITTYGSGHGVGMSQWGACGMAKEGKGVDEILHYYYQGITIGTLGNIAKSF